MVRLKDLENRPLQQPQARLSWAAQAAHSHEQSKIPATTYQDRNASMSSGTASTSHNRVPHGQYAISTHHHDALLGHGWSMQSNRSLGGAPEQAGPAVLAGPSPAGPFLVQPLSWAHAPGLPPNTLLAAVWPASPGFAWHSPPSVMQHAPSRFEPRSPGPWQASHPALRPSPQGRPPPSPLPLQALPPVQGIYYSSNKEAAKRLQIQLRKSAEHTTQIRHEVCSAAGTSPPTSKSTGAASATCRATRVDPEIQPNALGHGDLTCSSSPALDNNTSVTAPCSLEAGAAELQSGPSAALQHPDTVLRFLGTGSAEPSKFRGPSGLHLRLGSGAGLLLDTGEGAWGALVRAYGHTGALQQARHQLRRDLLLPGCTPLVIALKEG